MFIMEASSESSSSSIPSNFVKTDIRLLKNDVKVLQSQVEVIDTEGGKRLENVDNDLVFLWNQIKRVVKRSENVVIGLIVELEIKVDKLVSYLAKMEDPSKPGSSTCPNANIN